MKKSRIRDTKSRVRRSNICLIQIPERQERGMGKKMMAKDFSEQVKCTDSKSPMSSRQHKKQTFTPRHIIVKVQKIRENEAVNDPS